MNSMKRYGRLAAGIGVFASLMVVATSTPAAGTVRQVRPAAGFHEVRIETAGDAVIVQGNDDRVEIEAEPAVQRRVVAEVRNGVLTIRSVDGGFQTREAVVYRITAKRLASVRRDASGSVTVTGVTSPRFALDLDGSGDAQVAGLKAEVFTCKVSGSGSVEAAGTVGSQDVTIEGAGSYEAPNLISRVARVTISGSGSIRVAARERLTAEISGAGDIVYSGNPKVESTITGAGSVTRG